MQYVCLSSPLSPPHRSSRLPAASAGKRGASFKYVRKILGILDPSFPQIHTHPPLLSLSRIYPFWHASSSSVWTYLMEAPSMMNAPHFFLGLSPLCTFEDGLTTTARCPLFPFSTGSISSVLFWPPSPSSRRIKLRKNNVGQRP